LVFFFLIAEYGQPNLLAGLPNDTKEVYAENFISPNHQAEGNVVFASGDIVFW